MNPRLCSKSFKEMLSVGTAVGRVVGDADGAEDG